MMSTVFVQFWWSFFLVAFSVRFYFCIFILLLNTFVGLSCARDVTELRRRPRPRLVSGFRPKSLATTPRHSKLLRWDSEYEKFFCCEIQADLWNICSILKVFMYIRRPRDSWHMFGIDFRIFSISTSWIDVVLWRKICCVEIFFQQLNFP